MWLGEGSHFCADGSGVGVEVGRSTSPSVPQQGASDGGQRHRQRPVVIVRGHVGDTLATVAHLVSGVYVEGGVVGGAGGAVAAAAIFGLGGIGGFGRFWRGQRQRGDGWPVQAGDTARVAGEMLLRDRVVFRPILLTAVILERKRVKYIFLIDV